jgi:hypothetical protein
MSVQFKARLSGFSASMSRYVVDLKMSIPQVFKDQMRLFVKEIVAQTWPKTRKQGEDAVERDIRKAVKPLDKNAFNSIQNPRLKKALQNAAIEKDTDRLRMLFNRLGPRKNDVIVLFSPDMHKSQRNSRGRIAKSTGRVTFDTTAHAAYTKKVQGAVGWARAGWNAASARLGTVVAGWIKRHGTNGGSQHGNPSDPVRPNLSMINDAVEIPGYQAQVERALMLREKKMTIDVERRLAAITKQAGFQYKK